MAKVYLSIVTVRCQPTRLVGRREVQERMGSRYMAHTAPRSLRGLTFQRRKRPLGLSTPVRGDAGSSSLWACCMCSRIGASHWRCCASGRMVRGNDELSSCNRGGPDDDTHIARGFLQQASAFSAVKRCGWQCQLERLHDRNYVVSPSGTGDDQK
jgi:hypothetical protein